MTRVQGKIIDKVSLHGNLDALIEGLIKLQEKTATPTEYTQNISPDEGYDGLSRVIVNPIPPQYIIPSGTKYITNSGDYDVREYETANVAMHVKPFDALVDRTITTVTAEDLVGINHILDLHILKLIKKIKLFSSNTN